MRRIRHVIGLLSSSCLLVSVCAAQVPKTLDSALVYLKAHPAQDTNYVTALNVIGRELHAYSNPNYTRADSFLRVAEKLAHKLGYGLGLGKAYTNLGSICYLKDQPQQALVYFQKALSVAQTYRLSPQFTCGAITNVAAAYAKLQQYDKTVETELRALRYQEQQHIEPRQAGIYEGLGNAYRNLNKPREALPYYEQALAIRRLGKNTRGMAIAENNLGITYDLLKRYDRSLPYYQLALKHAEAVDFELLKADVLVNIGLVYRLTNQSVKALPYVKRSLAIEQKQQNKEGMATALVNLGQIYQDLKRFAEAESGIGTSPAAG